MTEETKTEEAGDKPKGGARKALIDKVDLVELIWSHAKFDEVGKATGFTAITADLFALKSFREGKKSKKYVKRYLQSRMETMRGAEVSIPLPVFTDIPIDEKPKTKSQLALEKAEEMMKAAGVRPEVIARNSDIHLGTERRKKDRRKKKTKE